MSVEKTSVSHFELFYGLSDKVINDVVEKSHLIFNPDDVLICNLVNEILL